MKGHYLVTCHHCGKQVWRLNKQKSKLLYYPNRIHEYCSQQCVASYHNKRKNKKCGWCLKNIIVTNAEHKSSKSGHNFCSHSCAASYNNTHKTKGTRCSKLEKWLAKQLPQLYKKLDFLFNDKTTIKSELDIYIPSLKLAFELNGIFHYEPIFGQEKLSQVQNNDKRKFQLCLANNIEFCTIDVSGLKYFKEQKALKYLDIIINIIDQKLHRQDNG